MIVRPIIYRLMPGSLYLESLKRLGPPILIFCSAVLASRTIAATKPNSEPALDLDHQHHLDHHIGDDVNTNMMSGSLADLGHFSSHQFDANGRYLPHDPSSEFNHDIHAAPTVYGAFNSNDNHDHLPDTLLSTENTSSSDHHVVTDEGSNEAEFITSSPEPTMQDSQNDLHKKPYKTVIHYKEYLALDLAERACKLDRGCQRKDRLNNTHLNFCTRYKLENLFSSQSLMSIMHDSTEDCVKILEVFINLDEVIEKFYTLFEKLLTRYNCHNGYSVKWTCSDCKRAYKDWLCATSLPYYMNGELIKPCISFCERVEQRCPYLHPITKEQYGGQPVFICRDPNIPFVPEITPDIPYSEPSKCYDLCHLSQNRTELVIDSLSKYDPDKCPDKSLVAEQVRNDIHCQVVQHPPITNDKTSSSSSNEDSDSMQHTGTTDSYEGDNQNINGSTGHATDHDKPPASVGIHVKKMNELRELLIAYQNQSTSGQHGHSDHR